MSDAAAARWVARAWTLLVASSALYFLADNEADNDLWVHVFAGRLILTTGALPRVDDLSYTAVGLPWVNHEWLSQAALAGLFDSAGSTGLWLCKLAIALLTAGLLWRSVALRTGSWWVRGPVLVLVFATLARGYAIRPQIITYLGVAALLSWLDRLDHPRRPLRRGSIIVLTAAGFALWANTHGGFILGLGILALYAVLPGRSRNDIVPSASSSPSTSSSPPRVWVPSPLAGEGQDGGNAWLRVAILLAATIAACCNPYGPSLFNYIGAELFAPHPLTEWQPIHVGDPAHLPFLMLLTAWVATLPFARTVRRQPWRAVLVAIVAALALRHQRHSPLLALCAAAPLAEQAGGALAWLRARTAFRLSAVPTAALAVALAALALGQLLRLADRIWQTRARVVYAASDYPVGALRFLRQRDTQGNLALPLDWGGYALWHAAPGVRVSLDGRFATVYPPRVVEDNFAFFRGDAGAGSPRLLEAYDTNLVLVPRGVVTPLDGRPDWQPLYSDAIATLFAKSGAPPAGRSEAAQGWLDFP